MILAGTDFSRGGQAAVRLAAAWARRTRDELALTHVLEGSAVALGEPDRRALLGELRESARSAGEDGAACTVDEGDAVSLFAATGAGVVVVGAEGGSATLLPRAGHVPAALARRGPTGVRLLIAPSGWTAGPSRRARATGSRPAERHLGERILVACAGDERDFGLVALAASIAAPAAEIHLAHVVDVTAARHHPPHVRAATAREAEGATREARQRLLDLAAGEIPLEIASSREPVVHVVRQGPVARDLAGLAASQSIDILVAGRGACAAALVALARCPVLVAAA